MPKSAKKKRDKAADFSKAKLKLGKGKQIASNAIDTSFKARSIALPIQSISLDIGDEAPTTRRKLTFEDLISYLKHYSAGTRRDSLSGLRELLEVHPELVNTLLTALMNACVRIIGDEDASVRKALLGFLSWLLPRIPKEDLAPHAPLLILFTTSAQTHIFPEIRIDAIRFLDIFLEVIPNNLVSGWTEKSGHGNLILEGYLGVLNAGTRFSETDGTIKATSTASVVLSPTSRLIVLKSLSNFLAHAMTTPKLTTLNNKPPQQTIPIWYLANSFTSSEAYKSFDKLLQPAFSPLASSTPPIYWQPEVEPDNNVEEFTQHFGYATAAFASEWTLQDISDSVKKTWSLAEGSANHSIDVKFVEHLARTLQSTLVSTFLDCAPVVFSPTSNPPGNELQLIVAMVEITRTLYDAIFEGLTTVCHGNAREDLNSLLGYMTIYFPFRPIDIGRDMKVEQSFQDLNLIFCELTSLYALSSNAGPSSGMQGAPNKSQQYLSQLSEGVLSLQAERVSKYIVQLLSGEAMPGSQIGRPITSGAYISLLPTLWALLNQSSANSSVILSTVIEHAIKTSSKSAGKRAATEFVARLVLLETELQYQGTFETGKNSVIVSLFQDWLLHLPKMLWELGSNNLSTTELILRFLLRLFQRKSRLVNRESVLQLRSRLIPYFTMTHPTRGQIPGPYTKLPTNSPLRRLALDVAETISKIVSDPADGNGLEAAIMTATAGSEDFDYCARLRTLV